MKISNITISKNNDLDQLQVHLSCEGPSRSWPWARLIYQFYTLQRLYTLPTTRVSHAVRVCKALKHFLWWVARDSLRDISKGSLYVRAGPLLSAVPQKTKLPSPTPQSSITQQSTKSNAPGMTYRSSSYLAKTRTIWYCGCTIFLGGSPCSN